MFAQTWQMVSFYCVRNVMMHARLFAQRFPSFGAALSDGLRRVHLCVRFWQNMQQCEKEKVRRHSVANLQAIFVQRNKAGWKNK